MWRYNYTNELHHHGVKGMKWGVRKYAPTSPRGALASYRNRKVDKGFDKWKKNKELRESAIEKGKKANQARIDYETNKSKETKAAYKSAKKDYKKAYRKNTTYRKGQIRGEVGSDMSRKYMKLAKKTSGRESQKYVNKYNIERDKARRAPAVGAARSNRKASIKRGMTIAVKSAVFTAGVSAGAYYLHSKGVNIGSENISQAIRFANKYSRYFY